MRANERRVFIGFGTAITLVITAVVLILLFVGGDIHAGMSGDRLRVDGVLGAGVTVDLDAVTGVELREELAPGKKMCIRDSSTWVRTSMLMLPSMYSLTRSAAAQARGSSSCTLAFATLPGVTTA